MLTARLANNDNEDCRSTTINTKQHRRITMTYWNDLNTYEEKQTNYGLIPNGTIAKVKMTIKRGQYNDPVQGWTDDYASKSIISGNIYLDAEYTVLEGKYAKRKIWGLIGLQSQNGPEWTNIGKSFIKGIINSAKGISTKDNSDAAVAARQIDNFKPLDGIDFIARIDVTKDPQGNSRNEIRAAITPDHKEYAAVMGGIHSQIILQQSSTQINNNINSSRPNWA